VKLWANQARCELSPDALIRCSIFPLFEKFARRENTRLTIYRKSAELFTRSQGMQVLETSLVAQTEFQEWKFTCVMRASAASDRQRGKDKCKRINAY